MKAFQFDLSYQSDYQEIMRLHVNISSEVMTVKFQVVVSPAVRLV